jgi:hypothetical protein
MGRVVSATPQPFYLRKKNLAFILQKAGWAQFPVGGVQKISLPPVFELHTVQQVANRCADYAIRAHNQDKRSNNNIDNNNLLVTGLLKTTAGSANSF